MIITSVRKPSRLRIVTAGDDPESTGEGKRMIRQYCAHLQMRHLSPATITRRRYCLNLFARFIEPTSLAEATAEHVEEFIGTRKAARTKHAYRSDLRSFYKWAAKKGLVKRSPAHDIPTIKIPRALPRPVRLDDAMGALTFGSLRIRRMVGLALFAGLRCAEVARLHAEDVDTAHRIITVRNGKGGKDRSVPMHPELAALMHGLPSSGPVFPGLNGPTVQPGTVSQAIRDHLTVCGIEASAHQLRHTFGTELARASGGNLVLCADWMGHADPRTTMGYVRLVVAGGDDIIGGMFGDVA